MALTINNTAKSNVTITNTSKPSGQTWADMTVSWANAAGTWGSPRTSTSKATKNTLTISNDAKP